VSTENRSKNRGGYLDNRGFQEFVHQRLDNNADVLMILNLVASKLGKRVEWHGGNLDFEKQIAVPGRESGAESAFPLLCFTCQFLMAEEMRWRKGQL
jgi:hypothetical protein